jgi:sortase family protein
MTGPVLPRPVEGGGPRMPASVLRRRPAEVLPPRPRDPLATPGPAVPRQRDRRAAVQPDPAGAPAPAPARRLFTWPRRRPRPVRGRRTVPLGLTAAALVFVGLFAVAAGLGAATQFDLSDLFRGPDKPPPRAFPVLEPSRPVRLTIPSIKVEAPILNVGLAKDGSVDVPPLKRHNEAGWFDEGPTPGQFGPALIVGHADTRSGPSIFHDLGRMRPGQKIEVLRRDHTVAVFEVNSIEHFGKSKLPIQRVYGDYSRPSLRLVTCGGTWLGGDQGYADNVIVFASLVDTQKT